MDAKLLHSLHATLGTSLSDFLMYGLFAGILWLFFYVAFRTRFRHRRISSHAVSRRQVRREFLCSLRSIGVFGLVAGGVTFAFLCGWTRIYLRFEDRGWTWFFISIGLMIVVHDTYFYWTHRLMHHRWLYRFVHHTHHLSVSPTPWAAYAFSPWEAFVQAGIGPLLVFTIPAHPVAFTLFMTWQIAFNVLGHCGYEIFTPQFFRCGLGVFLNSPTHHALHHEKFRANFGLYFNVWDRLMGTNHPDYEHRFALATTAPSSTSSQAEEVPHSDRYSEPAKVS